VRGAGSVLALAALLTHGATAAPSRWDRVREPNLARAERALTEAYRARLPKDISLEALSVLPAFESALAVESATVLELRGGAALEDAGVWFYLGDALVVGNHGRDEEGRRLLLRAIEGAPDSPEVSRAWLTIGIASNRLGDFAAEREAYAAALRVTWDRDTRAEIYMNRGEASMSLGDLRAARDDYSTALASSSDPELTALAQWGLAVALARDDDLPDALRYAGQAGRAQFRDLQNNPITAIDLPSVFFTPAYEIHYYRALSAMADSELTEDRAGRRVALESAASEWAKYLVAADPARDRWVKNAERHLSWCRRRLASSAPGARHR